MAVEARSSKARETLLEVYGNARMLEKHEQKYVASANVRKGTKNAATPVDHKGDQGKLRNIVKGRVT